MSSPQIGPLLREWRTARRMSQLDLALEAEISTRHLSYVETGKSQASRDILSRLADVLDMPLRERNRLLVAGGYAPRYAESALEDPEMVRVRRAIDKILEQQEPYPAFLLNRHWDILAANRAAMRVSTYVMHGRQSVHQNILRQFFDPADFRAAVGNWEEIAGELIRHLHTTVVATPTDTKARILLRDLLAYPGVPGRWRYRDVETAPSPLMATVLQRGDETLRFFSTITTFGTPRDITLEELHIECVFPEDDATARACRRLAEADAA
ncbi:MAG: XRE family transcriptional regulator [Alphaproteobacteria bacterium]|nr:MAG: XRE family transcriptional regulator [Alphaproteobacteria bacterium]